MSDSDSIRAETRAALIAMAEEAKEMQEAAGGSVTDAVAGWLAPRYAQAAREQLDALEGSEQLSLLRTFAQDWALLRKGDHSAARLRREQEWLELEREKFETGKRTKVEAGLEELAEQIRGNSAATAALDKLTETIGMKARPLSEEERADRIREIFKMPDRPKGGISPETRAEIERAMGIL